MKWTVWELTGDQVRLNERKIKDQRTEWEIRHLTAMIIVRTVLCSLELVQLALV